MKLYKNIIIGGGASGLMLAGNLKDKKSTLIIEKNSKLGEKIKISGGGRCNYTNKKISCNNYLSDKNFIKDLLNEYPFEFIYNYFKSRGLESITKNKTQLFCKNSSKDILDILIKDIKGVEVALNSEVFGAYKDGEIFYIDTSSGKVGAKNLIVASGGLSFPKLGATSIGYDIAKYFNHEIKRLSPALVGFTLQSSESFFKNLSGVSCDVRVGVGDRVLSGSLLFAHKGISGPVILNASLFWQKGQIWIDFLPNFDLESIKYSKKNISNLIPLPKRVIKAFLEHFDIEDKKATLLTKNEFERLLGLKKYIFAPAGTFGYSKAEVTKGGIDTNEIDINSFESKNIKNLYFIGEVLDVTGMLGGYNFHFAFASALRCSKTISY